ncbi:hypothetical protein LBMAG35_10840 [Chlorobiota bacterium]|jgi:hypothetical protein|nr:hypothetical protein LBMAG35_10840 [Chlorobiota bacterium]
MQANSQDRDNVNAGINMRFAIGEISEIMLKYHAVRGINMQDADRDNDRELDT